MSRVVEHLAALTAFRDRDALDVSLAGVLRDLLQPQGVAVHRCVGEPGQQRWITRARWRLGDVVPTADPAWVEIHSLPELAAHPQRLACLQGRRMLAVAGPPAQTHFPLNADEVTNGVLQIDTEQPLSAVQLRTVGSMLRVFCNFQSLLDYSQRDTLTGLLNRKTFEDCFLRLLRQPDDVAAAAESAGARRAGGAAGLWLGVIDIDHFKRVNDNHGHLMGDEVLLLLSRLMRGNFRYQDQLYRFGGEEFVVLMRCAQAEDAALAFERLRRLVEAYAFPQVGRISISVGFSAIRPDDAPATAFDRADKAVYHAKQNGRNQVTHHADLVRAGLLKDESRDSDVELF